MNIILSILFSLFFFTSLTAQKITLHGQVICSGSQECDAGRCAIHFSGGQKVKTDKKGFFTLVFDLKDTNTLLGIKSVKCIHKELQVVNLREMQHLLIEEKLNDTSILVYVMTMDEWNKRKLKIEDIYNKTYPVILKRTLENSADHPKGFAEYLTKIIQNDFPQYKPWMITNILSTPDKRLSETGQKAFSLLLNEENGLEETIQILSESNNLDSEAGMADLQLLGKLQVLNYDLWEAMRQYIRLLEKDSSRIGILMEFKELAILAGYPELVEEKLAEILNRVRDDVFLARNYSDLASIHDRYGEWLKAIAASNMALSYLYKLETKYPDEYWPEVTKELLNLAVTYKDMKTEDSLALELFDSVIHRITYRPGWHSDTQLVAVYFFANGLAGNLLSHAKSLKEAYPYYERMFAELELNTAIADEYPKEQLFNGYLNFCTGKEINGVAGHELDACYARALSMLEEFSDNEKPILDRSTVYAKIAEIRQAEQDNVTALRFYKKALAASVDNKPEEMTRVRLNLLIRTAQLLNLHGLTEESMTYFIKALNEAKDPGYYDTDNVKRNLGITWYNIGLVYKNHFQADSANINLLRAQNEMQLIKNITDEDIALTANIYYQSGIVSSEKGNINAAETDFLKALELFSQLADKGLVEYNLNAAGVATSLLNLQSEHLETTNKQDANNLIDNILLRLDTPGLHPDNVKSYRKDLENYRQIFSGENGKFEFALRTYAPLINQREQLPGNHYKSRLQSRIVEKLEQALEHSPPKRLKEITKALARETGNLAWYAIFDRKYVLAETSARKALFVDPTQTRVNTYLAHSLLLQDRIPEAKMLYDQLKDTIHPDYQTFGYYFLEEIEEMRKAGIDHPAFDEVVEMLVR